MLTQQFRRRFLDYFKQRGHFVVPSSSVAPHDDPTLLFVNAGMNPFKDVFLGESRREYQRAVSSQKCIRVGGKHNDLENVGHTRRHLTFFEMLGNFSFGDYFKKEAIAFAWEVTSEVFELDPKRVWASVFRDDDEAFELWTAYLPEERIVRLDERDNFWTMGETGPCGPCSELLFDRGESFGSAPTPYEDTEGERFVEFWNLVFMQYNRDASGRMTPLPKPSIDTGAGLERLVALKMGVDTVFDTDVLGSLIGKVEALTDTEYDPRDELAAAPFRVIADHFRTLSFAIADGVQPSNVERGYVLRKVLRRAVRYGRQLGIDRPFLGSLLPTLVEQMGEDFPELQQSQERITTILEREEEAFLRTLRRGGNLLSQVVKAATQHDQQISGDDAFKLKDTYGMPIEEILLFAKDSGLTINLERYQQLEHEARERSRAVAKVVRQEAKESVFVDFIKEQGESRFVGYEGGESRARVVGLLHDGAWVDQLPAGQEGMVLLDQTPFYAEKGGQVGDTGRLVLEGALFQVTDTQSPYTGITAHLGKVEDGDLKVGNEVTAQVDPLRRQQIANHHTATHLLHWALQEVLGAQVKQAGSVVAPDRLRFDFDHHQGLSSDEVRTIEDLVNREIFANHPVATREIAYTEAQQDPSIKQFFGDKYGTSVRVVEAGATKELCGGTHVVSTGSIGYFRIVKEGSIAAGVRRIEAVVGMPAVEFARGAEDLLDEVAQLLGTQTGKLLDRASKLLGEHTHYAQEIKVAQKAALHQLASELRQQIETEKVPHLVAQVDVDLGTLRALAEEVLHQQDSLLLVLGVRQQEKCTLLAAVTPDLVGKGYHAGKLIKQLAPLIGGGGGGKADRAQAGGKTPEQLGEALMEARQLIREP